MLKIMIAVSVFSGAAIVLDYATTHQARSSVYDQLKASTPTSIPEIAKPTLRKGLFYCETHNEGLSDQYMACWIPSHDASSASMALFGPAPRLWAMLFGPVGQTIPDRPGGVVIIDFVELGDQ